MKAASAEEEAAVAALGAAVAALGAAVASGEAVEEAEEEEEGVSAVVVDVVVLEVRREKKTSGSPKMFCYQFINRFCSFYLGGRGGGFGAKPQGKKIKFDD